MRDSVTERAFPVTECQGQEGQKEEKISPTGLRLRSPVPVSAVTDHDDDRSGVGGSSDCQHEQSGIVLPPEKGEQPHSRQDGRGLGLNEVPWLN
jgi:hypothetical protein